MTEGARLSESDARAVEGKNDLGEQTPAWYPAVNDSGDAVMPGNFHCTVTLYINFITLYLSFLTLYVLHL